MDRSVATLKLPRRINDIIAVAQHVVDSMTDNPAFPSPKPSLKSVAAHVEALRRAHAATLMRTVGTAATRDTHLNRVCDDLRQLLSYVQSFANRLDATKGAALIKSAGFSVKSRAGRGKQTLSARAGKASGAVHLTAVVAGKVAAYDWGYSLDMKKWSLLPRTLVAKTTVDSLTPGTTAYFRCSALRRTGMGDWSDPIAFVVT
jgi:hypothetical protein